MDQLVTIDSIERYLKSLTSKGRATNTIRAARSDLIGLVNEVGEHPVSEYEGHAENYLTAHREHVAAKTTRRRMGTFRGFGRWLGLSGPLSDYSAPKPPKQIPHPIPEGVEGVMRMLQWCEGRDEQCLVVLTGLLGLRVSEAVAATDDWVNPQERTLTIKGKGDKYRIIPIPPRVLSILFARMAEIVQADGADRRFVRLHERSARRRITALAKTAGLRRHVSSHDLRATLATAAYKKTKDLRAVQEILGHSDPRTTMVYTGDLMESMENAIDVLNDDEEDVA